MIMGAKQMNTSRREFLKSSAIAGGGLIIGFTLPGATRLAQAAGKEARISAYLRIAPNNDITVVCGLSEMGQGVHTAIPMLVAEELDVDWSRVRVEQAGVDQAFANPIFGMQATGGSTSGRGHWEAMGKAVSVNDAKAKAVPGVRQVLQIPSGVAVLADGYWAAKLGRDALEIQWDHGANASLSSEGISKTLSAGAAAGGAVGRNEGDAKAATPAKRIEAEYEAPYLSHSCMEPLNCTAWVRKDGVEIWAGTQSQGPAQGILPQGAGGPPGKVKVNTMYLGGGFGRRFAPDPVIGATVLSKIAGKPVKLVYSREDDMRGYFYRPASVTRMTGGLDASGRAALFTASVASPSIMEGSHFMKLPPDGVDEFGVEGIRDCPYDIPNLRVEYSRQEPGGIQVWFWRSVGHSQNSFFMESFIDELAYAAGNDPFEFRRSLLGKQPRSTGALELAAGKADWGKPLSAGVHRGIAVVFSFGRWWAQVAGGSVAADGTPKVHRVVAAVDCGMPLNPDIVKRQIESAIVYWLTAALYGKITFKDGRVEQSNFHDYRMLRMSEMPKVEVHIVPSKEAPGGIGEPGTPPIAPAAANAIFAATGKRIRKLPLLG